MKLFRFQAVVGTFLLLVSRHEVHARNYLLWALGLDSESQGERNLRKENLKARSRIAETRLRRKQGRKNEVDASTDVETDRTTEDSENSGTTISISNNNLSQKKDNARTRQKEHHFEKKEQNHEEKMAVPQDRSGAITSESQETARQKEKDRRYEKKLANHQAHAAAATVPVDGLVGVNSGGSPDGDKGGSTGGTRAHHRTNARKRVAERRYEKRFEQHAANTAVVSTIATTTADTKEGGNVGAQRNHKNNAKAREAEKRYEKKLENHLARAGAATAGAVIQVKDGKRGTKRNHKNTARARVAEKRFEKREAKHQANQAVDTATSTTKRNHKNGAKAREAEKRYEKKWANHKANVAAKTVETTAGNNDKARKRNQRNKTNENARQRQEDKHFIKRLENREKHQAARRHKNEPEIETVTLRDGGSNIQAEALIDVSPEMTAVATLYWVVFNNPDACPQRPCQLGDVFDPETKASILHGTGNIPDGNGDVTLVSSLYRTPEMSDYSGESLVDGLSVATSGALQSVGFYNQDAEVIIAIRSEFTTDDTMEKLLEMTEFLNSKDDLGDFVQFATYSPGETGFGLVIDWNSGQVEVDSTVHLTRQNDVLQVYVETNVGH